MSLLVPAFLLFCLTPSSCLTDYTCLSDMNPSLGVSLPRGDTEVRLGSKPFPLTCHLNPEHPEFLSGIRASDLAFKSNSTLLKSSIVDETSISSTFSPTIEGVTDVSCVILSSKRIAKPPNKGVCTQRILVGHPPLKITDFSCVSENWLSLNCTWTEPVNPIPTKYDLHFRTPGTRSVFKRCPSISELEWLLKRSFSPSLRMCFVNYETTPQYRHVTKKYDFYFNATNSLHPGGLVTRHTVDHFSIVRPGPASFLKLTSESPYNLQVLWNISREMVHFPPGLKQLVRFQSEWDPGQWTAVDTSHLNTTQDFFQISLPGLLLPYTKYTVEVTMQTNLPSTPPSLHSTPVQASLRTRPALPNRPPATSLASFEVVGLGSERTVIIYWQMMKDWEQNGPHFAYEVTNVVEEVNSIPLIPIKLTQSYAEFESMTSGKTFSFSIASRNSVGVSTSAATVVVPPATVTSSLLPRSVTKIFQEDDLFILSWLPPLSPANVTSYTLFWCLSSSGLDRPYQCSGHLDWKTITTKQLNGSLSHSLMLPLTDHPSPVYQLGVAANTDTQSSGMQWTTCTIKNERGIATRVTDVKVDTVSASSLVVRWRLDCSQMTGLVNSFLVKFCRLGPAGGNCFEGTNQTRVVEAGMDSVEITGLIPFSNYSFTVSVEGDLQQHRLPGARHNTREDPGPPSPPVTTLTLPSAPGSPPTRLAMSRLTSSLASLQWSQPSHTNGNICKYLVKVSKEDLNNQPVEPTEILENTIDIANLTSYTSYLVSVSACTLASSMSCVLCSNHWATHQFTTLVGTPSRPNTPSIKIVNSTAVWVEWDTNFQLGAPAVTHWNLRVDRGEGEDVAPYALETVGAVTRVKINLEQVSRIKSWGPDCANTSEYRQLYYYSVRAVVTNSAGEQFVGPWSVEQVQPVYCSPPLPWVMIVLVATLLPVCLLCLCATVYGSCSWYREKLAMIKKIQGGLDSREIGPVGHIVAPQVRAEYELGRLPAHTDDYNDSDMEEGLNTVLLRTHKNSSSSSQDSGVSSQPPASPCSPCQQVPIRQTDSIPSVVSGYISMGVSSPPQSPVSVLGKELEEVPGPGYCRVGHLDQEHPRLSYVPFTAIRPVQKDNSPGYISLGQVSELVLQPSQASAAYSRVGVVDRPCAKHGVTMLDTSPSTITIPGVARLEEESVSVSPTIVKDVEGVDNSRIKQITLSLDSSAPAESSFKEHRSPPYSGDFTCV